MKLVVATRNAGKMRELIALLAPMGYELVTLADCGVTEEVDEDAATFLDNAEKKARAALAATGLAALADDSGLEVDALDGAPGVRSARFASDAGDTAGSHDDAANNARLLRELESVTDERRGARFVCALVYLEPGGRRVAVEGACPGRIARVPKGDAGFGYDPLFLVDGEDGLTMAELVIEHKNRISHRARALHALVAELGR